jgi:hypothetical protein
MDPPDGFAISGVHPVYNRTFSFVTANADVACAIVEPRGLLCWKGIQQLLTLDVSGSGAIYPVRDWFLPSYGHASIDPTGQFVCAVIKFGYNDPYDPTRYDPTPNNGDIECWRLSSSSSRVSSNGLRSFVTPDGGLFVPNHGFTMVALSAPVSSNQNPSITLSFDSVPICALASIGSESFGSVGPRVVCNNAQLSRAWGTDPLSQPITQQIAVSSGTQFCVLRDTAHATNCVLNQCVWDSVALTLNCTAPVDPGYTGGLLVSASPLPSGTYRSANALPLPANRALSCPSNTVGTTSSGSRWITPMCAGLHSPSM